MYKKCNSNCIWFPYVDKEYEYIIKNGVKRVVNSKRYNCVFLNKKIKLGQKCEKYTTHQEMSKYRKELSLL